MNNLKLAYFTHDSISEGVGRSQILSLCQKLSKLDIKVSLFSFEKIAPRPELIEKFSESSIEWIWFPFESGGSFKAINRINVLRRVEGEFDIIHARGDLPALAAVLRQKEPVIWDIRSLWVEQRKVLNPTKFNPLTRGLINLLTRYVSRHVSGYNTLTQAVINVLKKKYPRLPKNFSVVSTCVDTDTFQFEPTLPKQPIGLLVGTYNSIYDSGLISKFSEYMIENYGHKIFWARGWESPGIPQELGQQKVFSALHEDIPKIIGDSSYGISVCRNELGDSLKAAMPTKIAEFLSVGRPVIVNSLLGDVSDLLLRNTVAVSLDTETDIPSAAKKLISLIDDPTTPLRCRKIAENFFSLDYAANRYYSLYSSILDGRSITKEA